MMIVMILGALAYGAIAGFLYGGMRTDWRWGGTPISMRVLALMIFMSAFWFITMPVAYTLFSGDGARR